MINTKTTEIVRAIPLDTVISSPPFNAFPQRVPPVPLDASVLIDIPIHLARKLALT